MFVAWKLDLLSLMKTHIPERHCLIWIPEMTRKRHARMILHSHLHIKTVGKYRSVSLYVFTILKLLLFSPHGRIYRYRLDLTRHELVSQSAYNGLSCRGVYCFRERREQTNIVVRRLLSRLRRAWFSLKALGFYVHMIVCVFILFGFRRVPLSYR